METIEVGHKPVPVPNSARGTCAQGWRNDSTEVGGLGSGGPEKKVLKCLKGPKTTYTTIAIAEKQSERSKKGPFSLYIGPPPGFHPGSEVNGARRGRFLPVPPPGFLQPYLRGTYQGPRDEPEPHKTN